MVREWEQMGNKRNKVKVEESIQTLGDLNVQNREVENEFGGKFLGFTPRKKIKDLTGLNLA